MEGTWFLIEVKEQEDIGKNEERRIKVTNTTLKFGNTESVTYAREFRGSGVDVHPATNELALDEVRDANGEEA